MPASFTNTHRSSSGWSLCLQVGTSRSACRSQDFLNTHNQQSSANTRLQGFYWLLIVNRKQTPTSCVHKVLQRKTNWCFDTLQVSWNCFSAEHNTVRKRTLLLSIVFPEMVRFLDSALSHSIHLQLTVLSLSCRTSFKMISCISNKSMPWKQLLKELSK